MIKCLITRKIKNIHLTANKPNKELTDTMLSYHDYKDECYAVYCDYVCVGRDRERERGKSLCVGRERERKNAMQSTVIMCVWGEREREREGKITVCEENHCVCGERETEKQRSF